MTTASDDDAPVPRLVFPETPAPAPARKPLPQVAPLSFDETPKMTATPNTSVGPLDFGASPASPSTPAPAPAPAPAAPKRATAAPLDFSHVPATKPTPAPVPAAPAGQRVAAAPLDFSNVPSPAPRAAAPVPARTPAPSPRPTGAPAPAFGDNRSPVELRAIEHAKTQFSDLFARHGSTIGNAIQQLLPFSLAQLETYGRSALDAQAQVIHGLAQITRDFNLLDANGLIQKALEGARAPAGLIDRLRGQGRIKPDQFRRQAEALRVQLDQFLPRIEQVRKDLKDQGDRLPVLLAALSAAVSVSDAERDPAIGVSVANRRTVLTQAVQQNQVLLPQIDEMRRQAVEQQGTLTHFLQVTLPALELAAVQVR